MSDFSAQSLAKSAKPTFYLAFSAHRDEANFVMLICHIGKYGNYCKRNEKPENYS